MIVGLGLERALDVLHERLEPSDVGEQSAVKGVVVRVYDFDFELAETSLELRMQEAPVVAIEVESHRA